MDALTDILDTVRVEGGVFCRAELSAPWGLHSDDLRVAIFHVIVEGEGQAQLMEGGAPLPWQAGDLVLAPHGAGHRLMHGAGALTRDIHNIDAPRGEDGLPCLTLGGGGARTAMLCGTFRFGAEGRDFLLSLLPRLMVVRGGSGTAEWLDSTLRMFTHEVRCPSPGSPLIIARLAEVLFVQVLRAWFMQQPEARRGCLRALGDPQLSRALAALHREPAHPWTAATLARKAGLSRSAFYARFQELLEETPASYLTRWRMVLARQALKQRQAALAEVAEQVGYGSEAAFSRAFKREVGVSPSVWREQAA